MTPIGLRVDVDTYRGTERGVPVLGEILRRRGLRATFFFTVGPDNMGRHLWRLVRPAFLVKMLRTRAASLYGWDILLRGTLWPGPVIGRGLGHVIRAAADAGHEIGLHAWDHHAWQSHVHRWSRERIARELRSGTELLTEILGRFPTCSAAPAWRCTDNVLVEKEALPFAFNSDCRGETIFVPKVDGRELRQPQVPTTLPTYDEAVRRNGVTPDNYNEFLLARLCPGALNVLTIHAEAEGGKCRTMFEEFLDRSARQGMTFVPLGELPGLQPRPLPCGALVRGEVEGREGWLACQRTLPPSA